MTAVSLIAQLAAWARRRPDHLFLDGGVAMTYSEAEREVRHRSERVALAAAARRGPAVLTGSADAQWVLDLLACMCAETPVAMLPATLHPSEQLALEDVARPAVQISGNGHVRASETGDAPVADWRSLGAAVAFSSSGTTGAPRWVLRSPASLADEGTRYVALWKLHTDDVILIATPLCHAYAFGAGLCAALAAGCRLVICPWRGPRALIAEAHRHGATILPLVAPMAGALASADADAPPRSIRIAMVGAGRPALHVSQAFARRFRVPLSHNYGTSETGALLASLDPVSPACTGTLLDGVHGELVCDGAGAAQLWVRLASPPIGYVTPCGLDRARLAPGGWWASGDLFARDIHGCYSIVGRAGDLIRRAGRTISPREIEAVLLSHPRVQDACVRGQADGADELIEAHVELTAGASLDAVELRQHLARRLADYKLPHRWSFYDQLPRTWSSKVMTRALRACDARRSDRLLSLLTGYRYSEALLCAHRVGLLDALSRAPVPLDALASDLRLDPVALELFLSVLTRAGVVDCEEGRYRLHAARPSAAIFALEAQLRDDWLRAEAMEDVLRAGLAQRRFELVGPQPAFADAYVAALCGSSQRLVGGMLARLLPPADRVAVLEIGRGIGMIPSALRERIRGIDVELVALAPGPALLWRDCRTQTGNRPVPVLGWHELAVAPGRYDLIVLTNAIHWLPPALVNTAMSTIRAGLKPGGTLAIGDIFLPPPGDGAAEEGPADGLALDWLTHGGTHWLHADALAAALKACGLPAPSIRRFGALGDHLIVARVSSAVTAVATPVSNVSIREVSV